MITAVTYALHLAHHYSGPGKVTNPVPREGPHPYLTVNRDCRTGILHRRRLVNSGYPPYFQGIRMDTQYGPSGPAWRIIALSGRHMIVANGIQHAVIAPMDVVGHDTDRDLLHRDRVFRAIETGDFA